MRSQIVPQEFKGNAEVFTEQKGVLHADGVVDILRILVHQELKDPLFAYPLCSKAESHITLFLRWCTSPRGHIKGIKGKDIKQKYGFPLMPWSTYEC